MRAEVLQPFQPRCFHDLPVLVCRSACLDGRIDDVFRLAMHVGMWVERMLETGTHQDAFITAHDIHRAVALVYVKINNRYPLQLVKVQRPHGGQRDVVVEAEAHGFTAFGMVPGWPGAHKRVGELAAEHHIDRFNAGASGKSGGSQGVRHHGGIGVGIHPSPGGLHQIKLVQIAFGVHGLQLVPGGFVRSHPVEILPQAGVGQVTGDGCQSLGALRVLRPHIVFHAVVVREESRCHTGPEHSGCACILSDIIRDRPGFLRFFGLMAEIAVLHRQASA